MCHPLQSAVEDGRDAAGHGQRHEAFRWMSDGAMQRLLDVLAANDATRLIVLHLRASALCPAKLGPTDLKQDFWGQSD